MRGLRLRSRDLTGAFRLDCYRMNSIKWLVSTAPVFRAYADVEAKKRLDCPKQRKTDGRRPYAKRQRASPVTDAVFKIIDDMPIGTDFNDALFVESIGDIAPNTAFKARAKYISKFAGCIKKVREPVREDGRWVGAVYRKIKARKNA